MFTHTSYFLVLEAYVKTNFTETNEQNKLIGCGSITDGIYKIETHIMNFTNDEYSDLQINKGDKIELIGIMQTTSIIHLNVLV